MDHAPDPIIRPVPATAGRTAVLVMLALVVLATAGWEAWARSRGLDPGYYHDGNALWARERHKASRTDRPLVIIGSSRVFFDVDLDTWEEVDGKRPIMLAIEGTDPQPFLHHLANDPDFNGTVLVGITPPIFFTGYAERQGTLAYYENETPSEWLSQRLGMFIEPLFAFQGAGRRDLALFKFLSLIELPNRPGIPPPHLTIHDIADSDADRNTRLWHRVWEDPVINAGTTMRWRNLLESAPKPPPDAPPFDVPAFLAGVKPAVEKIRARGGDVVFVRCPSEGFFAAVEAAAFPKAVFWDQISPNLDVGTVHFADNPGLQGFRVPEWSHLHADDRAPFTRALVPLVETALRTRRPVVTLSGNQAP